MKAKLYIGTMAAIIWVAAIIGKHFWPDLDTGAIVAACASVLAGLGINHVGSMSDDPAPAVPVAPAAPVPPAQGGFALVPFLAVVAVLAVAMLSGCASIDNAGHSSYTVTAVKDAAGKAAGYELAVKDGKEYQGRQVQFQAMAGAVTLTIVESGAKAFPGQALAVKSLTVMPVTGLTDLITGGPKP